VHDRRRRLPVRREAVEEVLELADRAQVQLEEVAVLAGDPVAPATSAVARAISGIFAS
jgi:hypothetical protein